MVQQVRKKVKRLLLRKQITKVRRKKRRESKAKKRKDMKAMAVAFV